MNINDGRVSPNYNTPYFKKNISASIIIIWVSTFCLLWIITYKVWFVNINECFPSAFEIGEIFYNLFLSVIASTIFYFIVVFLPEKRKKQIIRIVIYRRIGKLNLDFILIKNDLFKLKNHPVQNDLPADFNEIVKLCEGILLTDIAPRIHNNPPFYPKNWFEYFDYYFALEKQNIDHLNRYWEEIPAEVKVLIDQLESNTLKSGLEMYKKTGYSNKLSDLGGPIWTHLNTLNRIVKTFQNECE